MYCHCASHYCSANKQLVRFCGSWVSSVGGAITKEPVVREADVTTGDDGG